MTDYDLGKVVGDAGAKGDKGDKGDTGNGIQSIVLRSTSGKVKTYRITFTDGDTFDYQVTDGSDASVTVDSSLSSTSTNPVQNKVINSALNGKASSSHSHSIGDVSNLQSSLDGKSDTGHNHTKSNITDFAHTHDDRYYTETETDNLLSGKASSSHSHSKSDITDFPTIPSKISDLTNDSDFIEKSSTTGLVKNDGTVDTTTYLPSSSYVPYYYATCATAAATQDKEVTITDFTLETGVVLVVKFTNANTYNGTARLKINSLTAIDIATVGTTKTSRYHWTAGEAVTFVYDGANFVMINTGIATTSYYGVTKLSSSTSSTSASLAATPAAVKAAYDLANSKADPSDIPANTSDLTNDSGFITSSSLPTKVSDLTNDSGFITSSSLPTKTSDLTNDGADGTNVFVASNDSRLSDARTPTSHTHGQVTNDGKITSSAVTVASGDNIVITDASDSSKLKRVANVLATHIKDSNAHSNIGSSASATQGAINTAIDTALGTINTNLSNKVNTSAIANNLTTTSSGYVLDARQGKALADLIGDAITYINGTGGS